MAVNVRNLKKTGKGAPPMPAGNHNSLKRPGGKNVPLQLNIDPEERRQFRMYAAALELDMSVLFVKMFHEYKENHIAHPSPAP